MIQNQVKHQIHLFTQEPDILPASQRGIDNAIVDHGETVIGRVRIEGEQMDRAEDVCELIVQKKLT